MSQSSLNERIRIFNRQGFELATFRAMADRSWVIGKEGRCSFRYPSIKTDIVNQDLLQFGNYLLVENSRLPAWVGIIDTPRGWDATEVEVNAYTMERMFSYRRGSLDTKYTGSAGDIFEQMVNYINSQEQTIMRAGSIWRGGSKREETINPNKLINNLEQLQERSLEEYEFVPQVSNGRLTVFANWRERLGKSTPITLNSAPNGGNIETPTMTEDGDIANDVFGYGDGLTWQTRPSRPASDAVSISKYGLRQDSQEWRGVKQISTIETNNEDYLNDNKEPKKIFQVTALNVGETFDYIRIGNKAGLKIKNIGFSNNGIGVLTNVRILGISYSPKNGQKVKLVLEEVK